MDQGGLIDRDGAPLTLCHFDAIVKQNNPERIVQTSGGRINVVASSLLGHESHKSGYRTVVISDGSRTHFHMFCRPGPTGSLF